MPGLTRPLAVVIVAVSATLVAAVVKADAPPTRIVSGIAVVAPGAQPATPSAHSPPVAPTPAPTVRAHLAALRASLAPRAARSSTTSTPISFTVGPTALRTTDQRGNDVEAAGYSTSVWTADSIIFVNQPPQFPPSFIFSFSGIAGAVYLLDCRMGAGFEATEFDVGINGSEQVVHPTAPGHLFVGWLAANDGKESVGFRATNRAWELTDCTLTEDLP